ncbi:MAG: hypothetical protein JXR82_13985 [Marinifilaceae bacterium]|nr:hypothetical protein [Marinifilaceae bacterium]
MKKSLALLLIIIGLHVSGQTTIDSIVKIEIVDYENFDSARGRTYQLVPQEDSVAIFNMNKFTGNELLKKLKKDDSVRYEKIVGKFTKDSMEVFKFEINTLKHEYFIEPTKIGCVSRNQIDSLLFELERIPSKSTFKELGLNQKLLDNNSIKYLELFLQNHFQKSKLKESQKAYCLNQLQNTEILQKSAKELIRTKAFSNYGHTSLTIFGKNDSLKYQTKGTSYFMLPWYNENKEILTDNPKVSILIGSLLPNEVNGDLLIGKNFVRDLYFYIIDDYCLTRQDYFKKK